jgi:hypothetical protein
MAKQSKPLMLRFDGPGDVLYDAELDGYINAGEVCEVPPKIAERLLADPLVSVEIIEED